MKDMSLDEAVKIADDLLEEDTISSNRLKNIVELCLTKRVFYCPKNNSDSLSAQEREQRCMAIEHDISGAIDSLMRLASASYQITKMAEPSDDDSAEKYKRFLGMIRKIDFDSKKCELDSIAEECRKCKNKH